MSDLHFIGFREDKDPQQWAMAVLVFGYPDWVHMWHDERVYGYVGEDDVLIFANKESPNVVREFTYDDSAHC